MGSVKGLRRSCHAMSAVVCGLDVHKDSTYATILNSEGKIIDQTKMVNEKVLSYVSHFKVGKVAMEASTSVASLYRQLVSEGFDVVVSHPKKTRYIAEARIKSDRVDVMLKAHHSSGCRKTMLFLTSGVYFVRQLEIIVGLGRSFICQCNRTKERC